MTSNNFSPRRTATVGRRNLTKKTKRQTTRTSYQTERNYSNNKRSYHNTNQQTLLISRAPNEHARIRNEQDADTVLKTIKAKLIPEEYDAHLLQTDPNA